MLRLFSAINLGMDITEYFRLSTEEPILQPSGRPEPLLTPTELPTTLPASVTPDRPWSPEEQGFLPGRQEHWLLTET